MNDKERIEIVELFYENHRFVKSEKWLSISSDYNRIFVVCINEY